MRQLLRGTAVGMIIGVAFGGLGALKFSAQSGVLTAGDRLSFLGIGIGAGGVAGALFSQMRGLRSRGRGGYVLAWVLAVAPAAGACMVPIAMRSGEWIDVVGAASLGAGAGLGLGLFSYALRQQLDADEKSG
ncbi:MAG: hypothetical protein JWN79_94 [Gemmatimonadetes bacterium]|jgi:hypothetical protein|nr:hypothetical protein [Gemmatimonadota bacterium]